MFSMVKIGFNVISVTLNVFSIYSNLPLASQVKDVNFNLDSSVIAINVVIKQLLTAAVNKCSGDQIPSTPPVN